MISAEEFGKRLREARESKKIKQKALAEILDIAPQSLSAYETGKKYPPLNTLIDMAVALNVSLDWLFNLNSSKEQTTISSLADIAKIIETFSEYLFLDTLGVSLEYCDVWSTEPLSVSSSSFSLSDSLRGSASNIRTENRAIIAIDSNALYEFFEKRLKVKKLVDEGVVDQDFYNAWYIGECEKLKKIPLKKIFSPEWLADTFEEAGAE